MGRMPARKQLLIVAHAPSPNTERLRDAVIEGASSPQISGIDLRFVANIDPRDMAEALTGLDPETTLVVVVSKTFTTQETLANADAAKEAAGPALDKAKEAVSGAIDSAKEAVGASPAPSEPTPPAAPAPSEPAPAEPTTPAAP